MKKQYRKPAYSIRKLEDMTQEEREEYEAVIRRIKEEKNMKKEQEFRESCDPFYSISANEVVQKSTGKIAYFENSGEIREESKEEVEMGPSSLCYKELMKKLDREKV